MELESKLTDLNDNKFKNIVFNKTQCILGGKISNFIK